MTSIKVPPLGESIVEATVSRWLKSEGDAIAPGDTLVELETDKVTVEVPSVTGGVLKKRFAREGDVVKLDQMLAEVDEKANGGAPVAKGAAADAAKPVAAPQSRPAAAPPRARVRRPRNPGMRRAPRPPRGEPQQNAALICPRYRAQDAAEWSARPM